MIILRKISISVAIFAVFHSLPLWQSKLVASDAKCLESMRALQGFSKRVDNLGEHRAIFYQPLSRSTGFFGLKSWAYAVNHATDFRPRARGQKPGDYDLTISHPAVLLNVARRGNQGMRPLVIYDLSVLKALANLGIRQELQSTKGTIYPLVALHSDITGTPASEIPVGIQDLLTSLRDGKYLENLGLGSTPKPFVAPPFQIIKQRGELQAQEGIDLLDELSRRGKVALIQFEDSDQIQIIIPGGNGPVSLPDVPFLQRARNLRTLKELVSSMSDSAPNTIEMASQTPRNSISDAGVTPETTLNITQEDLDALSMEMGPDFVARIRAEREWATTDEAKRVGAAVARQRAENEPRKLAPSGRVASRPVASTSEVITQADIDNAEKKFIESIEGIILAEGIDSASNAWLQSAKEFLDFVRTMNDVQRYSLAKKWKDSSSISDIHSVLQLIDKKSTLFETYHEAFELLDINRALGLPVFESIGDRLIKDRLQQFQSTIVGMKSEGDVKREIVRIFFGGADRRLDLSHTSHVKWHADILQDAKDMQVTVEDLFTIGDRLLALSKVIEQGQKPNSLHPINVEGISFVLISGLRIFVKVMGKELLVIGLSSHSEAEGKARELRQRLGQLESR